MNDKLGTSHKVMKREIVVTADGSSSLLIPEMNEMYHSKKGAIQESQFVYIDHGIALIKNPDISVLEIGMGTGLNVVLSLLYAAKHNVAVQFDSLEPFPLTVAEWTKLNYGKVLELPHNTMELIHTATVNTTALTPNFNLRVFNTKLEDWHADKAYDVIYFDAFAPNKQGGPWVKSNIQKAYNILKSGGVLTTYCAQGQFKRDLKEVGFVVTNPEGPMGKREITVAYK